MDKKDDLKQALIYQPKLLSFDSQRAYRLLEDAIRDHISSQEYFGGDVDLRNH